MKQIFSSFLMMMILVAVGGFAVRAQVKPTADEKLIAEITEVRRNLFDAIKKRDKKSLETLYADDFTHTHASGQVDDKAKRIAALASSDLTIESAQVDTINIRFYGRTTAVAVGQSTIEATKYRWTLVYTKSKNRWQIAASQATRLAEK